MTPEENCDRFRKYCKDKSLNEKNPSDQQIIKALSVIWANTEGD